MDSDYSPPPTFSSGNLRNVEPELPADNQPTVEVQAPSMSFIGITNSEPNISTEGQRQLVADEAYVQAQSISHIRLVENSFTGGDVDLVQAPSAPAPDLDSTGHVNESLVGLNGYSGSEKAPTYSDINQRDQSNPGHDSMGTDQAYDLQENIAYSIPGRHFPRGNLTGGPYNMYN